MKNMILLVALPFILGCTATAQTTPSKQPKTNRVETFSQLDSTEPAERPNWLQVVPESTEGFYFVGMSTKRTEKRNARNESFNDALIGFARYCGLNVQYLSEHRDTSMGGNGGLIDTFSKGNTVAKMTAEMLLGNVATKDRYTEKYSSFYGGSFMGHTFVDATLIYVPKTEMDLCRENRKQANTFLAQKTNKIKKLKAKNESLENQLIVEKQNTSVALAQAQQSSKFFKQVLTKPTHNVVKNKPAKNKKVITKTNNDYILEIPENTFNEILSQDNTPGIFILTAKVLINKMPQDASTGERYGIIWSSSDDCGIGMHTWNQNQPGFYFDPACSWNNASNINGKTNKKEGHTYIVKAEVDTNNNEARLCVDGILEGTSKLNKNEPLANKNDNWIVGKMSGQPNFNGTVSMVKNKKVITKTNNDYILEIPENTIAKN